MGDIQILGGASVESGNFTPVGTWNFLVAPLVNGNPIVTANTYANAVAGTRFTILYNGTAWPGARPSTRVDIYFDLIGGSEAVADPAWMLNGDAREIVP